MLKAVLATALLATLTACAHQPSEESKNSTPERYSRADDAFNNNDGYCDAREARQPELYADCRQTSQQRRSRPGLSNDDRLQDARIEDLGQDIDRSLPNLGNNRLGL